MSVFFAILYYVATLVLLGGLAYKITQYFRAPAPLVIPTMPAPRTQAGAAARVGREVVLFESLFKSNKVLWILAVLFHVGLLLVLIRHLRYPFEPVPAPVVWLQPFGIYGGMAMVVGLLGLWARRFVVDRVRYISRPSDHLILALLVAIGLSGLGMKFVAHTDIVAVKAFFVGLWTANIQPLPSDPLLLIHISLVAVLMIVFPMSKLLHVPGVFFSPTRNQPDDSRERRHVAPWAADRGMG